MNSSVATIHADILARLQAVRRKQNSVKTVSGVFSALAVFGGMVLAAVLLEQIFYLGTGPRTVVFWLLGVACGILLVVRIALPSLRLLRVIPDEDDHVTAERVGHAFPGLGDRLINILDLFQEYEQSTLYSAELIRAAFVDIQQQIEGLDFLTTVSSVPSRRMRRAAG